MIKFRFHRFTKIFLMSELRNKWNTLFDESTEKWGEMKMSNEEKIDMARKNWMKASDELGFNIISPYYIIKDNKECAFFAFIPQYGSPQGTLIDLIFSPMYETNNKMREIANELGYFHSFINIDAYIDYNQNHFLETIEDWGKFDEGEHCEINKPDKYANLTAKGKDEYIKILENIGWFNYSNNSKDELYNRLSETENNNDFAFCLYDLWFDTEGFEDCESYEFLLTQVIEIIKPENCTLDVEYIAETNNVKMTITTQNNLYEYSVNQAETSDGINVIDDFINKIVLENTNKKFFPIPTTDQTMQFVYMPEEIYKKAMEVGIIPELGIRN